VIRSGQTATTDPEKGAAEPFSSKTPAGALELKSFIVGNVPSFRALPRQTWRYEVAFRATSFINQPDPQALPAGAQARGKLGPGLLIVIEFDTHRATHAA